MRSFYDNRLYITNNKVTPAPGWRSGQDVCDQIQRSPVQDQGKTEW